MKTKNKKKNTVKSKRGTKKALKVWSIFHFKERFELSENIRKCRKSALEFSRDFVGDAGGDEAVGYQRQFALLSNGDGLEFGLLYGLYRLLVNMAAKQSRAFRGYLLDAKNQPLSDAQIGKLLKIETRRMRKFLRQFASVDLLERVELPEFDVSVNEPPPRDDDDNDSGGSKQKSVEETRKTRSGGRGRTRAENSARGRRPLEENGKRVNKKYFKDLIDNGSNDKCAKKRQRDEAKSNAIKGPPTTTQPLLPQPSDAAGGFVIQFHNPPGSADNKRNEPQAIGDIIREIGHRYDLDSQRFGCDICRALGLGDSSTPQGRREIGSFGSLWTKAKASGLPPPVLTKLWDRSINEARKIGKRRTRRGKPAAIWCSVFNKILVARCTENQRKVI